MQSSKKGNKHLYVDELNSQEILGFLEGDSSARKKFKHIVEMVLNHTTTKDVFEHEPVNAQSRGVYSLKLKIGLNPRIYCKTYEVSGHFHIIMSELIRHKSTQNLSKELKRIISTVGSYEYDIPE